MGVRRSRRHRRPSDSTTTPSSASSGTATTTSPGYEAVAPRDDVGAMALLGRVFTFERIHSADAIETPAQRRCATVSQAGFLVSVVETKRRQQAVVSAKCQQLDAKMSTNSSVSREVVAIHT